MGMWQIIMGWDREAGKSESILANYESVEVARFDNSSSEMEGSREISSSSASGTVRVVEASLSRSFSTSHLF